MFGGDPVPGFGANEEFVGGAAGIAFKCKADYEEDYCCQREDAPPKSAESSGPNEAASVPGAGDGRKLDFIAQEMLREANTIASKANDATIAKGIVEIKGAIDRLKEQVQNVE